MLQLCTVVYFSTPSHPTSSKTSSVQCTRRGASHPPWSLDWKQSVITLCLFPDSSWIICVTKLSSDSLTLLFRHTSHWILDVRPVLPYPSSCISEPSPSAPRPSPRQNRGLLCSACSSSTNSTPSPEQTSPLPPERVPLLNELYDLDFPITDPSHHVSSHQIRTLYLVFSVLGSDPSYPPSANSSSPEVQQPEVDYDACFSVVCVCVLKQ